MTKTLRKPVTMLLALCMVFTLAVGACADDITSSGGSATSPVNMTTTNEGIGGGDGGGETTPTRMSVTVPTGAQVATASNEATQSLITAPIDGCYMTGVGDSTRNSVSVAYSAIVTPLSNVVENANVANVVFVIEWDDVTE